MKVVASASIRAIEDSADRSIANSGERNQLGSHSQAALACWLLAPAGTQIGDALCRFGLLRMAAVEAADPSSGCPPALDQHPNSAQQLPSSSRRSCRLLLCSPSLSQIASAGEPTALDPAVPLLSYVPLSFLRFLTDSFALIILLFIISILKLAFVLKINATEN